jgi:hypothetical protein
LESETVRFVLADDGCEVDDETLQYLPQQKRLIALKPNEIYSDVSTELQISNKHSIKLFKKYVT